MVQKKLKSLQVVPTTSKSKRIGFFSAFLLVMGSCIGSGIFFKSGTIMQNSNNSIVLALASWVIAALAVLAMAMALIDITAKSRKDDRGFISWLRRFNSYFVYKMSKNYFAFFYLPVNYFIIPLYAIQSMQSGLSYIGSTLDPQNNIVFPSFGTKVNDFPWWGILLIVVGIDLWFIIVSGISIKIGNLTNIGISIIKFLPLVFALLIGFIIIGLNKQLPDSNVILYQPPVHESGSRPLQFSLMNPFIGVIASLSSVFFAYDGFYVAAGVQNQLKKPKQISLVLVIGLVAVTVIYFVIALSITLGAPQGNWNGIAIFFIKRNLSGFFAFINIVITFGIIGIINAYAMWAPLFYKTLINSDELPFSKPLKKINNQKTPWAGIIYQLILVIPIVVAFCLIGALAFENTSGYTQFSEKMMNLYSFDDIISNWETVFAFVFISLAILGYIRDSFSRKPNSLALSNKIHKKLKQIVNLRKAHPFTKKEIFLTFCGIFSFVLVFLGLLFSICAPFVNLSVQVIYEKTHNIFNLDHHVGNISLICILFAIVMICVFPSLKEWLSKHDQQVFKTEEVQYFIDYHQELITKQKAIEKKTFLIKKNK